MTTRPVAFSPMLKFSLLSTLVLSACVHSRSDTLIATPMAACNANMPAPDVLRVASYNIKSLSHRGERLEDVANVIREMDADVVALQEVQTHGEDQASTLARKLGYPYHVFAAAIRKPAGDYGVALLSRLPLEKVDRVRLDSPLAFESRMAIDATACLGGRRLHVISVHTDFMPVANAGNAVTLAAYLKPLVGSSVVLMGDLNAQPGDDAVKAFTKAGMHDLFAELVPRPSPTFPSDKPNRRLDYVLVDAPLRAYARSPEIPPSQASDHRPITASFELPGWYAAMDHAPSRGAVVDRAPAAP